VLQLQQEAMPYAAAVAAALRPRLSTPCQHCCVTQQQRVAVVHHCLGRQRQVDRQQWLKQLVHARAVHAALHPRCMEICATSPGP
jgi:hypothetical protein